MSSFISFVLYFSVEMNHYNAAGSMSRNSRSPSPCRVNFLLAGDDIQQQSPRPVEQIKSQTSDCTESGIWKAGDLNLQSEVSIVVNELTSPTIVSNASKEGRKIPVPLPRTSIKKNLIDVKSYQSREHDSEFKTSSDPQFTTVGQMLSPRYVPKTQADADVKPIPRRIFTFKSNEENNVTRDNNKTTKLSPLVNKDRLPDLANLSRCDEEITGFGFNRERNLSLESKRSFIADNNDGNSFNDIINARRSFRENAVTAKKASGKQALIKLYDLPDGKIESKNIENSKSSILLSRESESLVNNYTSSLLMKWELMQRTNLDQEERNRLNKSQFGRPVSSKIKEMVKFPGTGLKQIFTKDKKTDIMGTVDGARDIVFTKIPFGGKPEDDKDILNDMKSPDMVKNIFQNVGNAHIVEDSVYSDVHSSPVHTYFHENEIPSSPVYVKTLTDRFDSEILFGDINAVSRHTTTKQMNIERSKDIARSKVSPRQRSNRATRDLPGEHDCVTRKDFAEQPLSRRSLRLPTSDKTDSKILTSSSASNLMDFERRQRFNDASAVFRKEKSLNRKSSWNDEKIPLYTSSWKFLTPKLNDEKSEKVISAFPDYMGPPVRLTQIIGDSMSQPNSNQTTPLISPRESLPKIQNQHIELFHHCDIGSGNKYQLFSSESGQSFQIPSPPPRKSKISSKFRENSKQPEAEFTVAFVDEDGIHEQVIPPTMPKRKSFHYGMITMEPRDDLVRDLKQDFSKQESKTYETGFSLKNSTNRNYDRSREHKATSKQLQSSSKKVQNLEPNSSDRKAKYNQWLTHREKSKDSDRTKYRHQSADRYTGNSNYRNRSGDHGKERVSDTNYGKYRDIERRVKVTTYKWGDKVVQENIENYKKPPVKVSEILPIDHRMGKCDTKKCENNRSDWLGMNLKTENAERHRRSARRRDYDERRTELQRRSRSEGRCRLQSGDKLVSVDGICVHRTDPITSIGVEGLRRNSGSKRDDSKSRTHEVGVKRNKAETYSCIGNGNVYFSKQAQLKLIEPSYSTKENKLKLAEHSLTKRESRPRATQRDRKREARPIESKRSIEAVLEKPERRVRAKTQRDPPRTEVSQTSYD